MNREETRLPSDYYEILQISPNADQETVRRIYKIHAQRFHPDNLESGNAETFKRIAEAYEVLSDPDRRAEYDAQHRIHRPAPEPAEPPAPSPHEETERREQIMLLLYRRRLTRPDQPSLGLRDLEMELRTPKVQLEFSLWYLKECGYLTRTDGARHTITIQGVQFAETIARRPAGAPRIDR
jgi:curved DNA-binding protein CbpA